MRALRFGSFWALGSFRPCLLSGRGTPTYSSCLFRQPDRAGQTRQSLAAELFYVMNTHEVPRSRNAWTGIQRAANSLARLLPLRGREPSAEAGLRQVAPPPTGHHACSAAAACSASATGAAASARDAPGGAAEGAGVAFGYAGGLEHRYELGRELGRGGNAVVRIVRDRRTGLELACKTIKKVCAPRQHAAFPPNAPRRVACSLISLRNRGKSRRSYASSGPTQSAARGEQKLRAQSAAPARASLTPSLAPAKFTKHTGLQALGGLCTARSALLAVCAREHRGLWHGRCWTTRRYRSRSGATTWRPCGAR